MLLRLPLSGLQLACALAAASSHLLLRDSDGTFNRSLPTDMNIPALAFLRSSPGPSQFYITPCMCIAKNTMCKSLK